MQIKYGNWRSVDIRGVHNGYVNGHYGVYIVKGPVGAGFMLAIKSKLTTWFKYEVLVDLHLIAWGGKSLTDGFNNS